MKKLLSKVLALTLVSSMVLSGCGNTGTTDKTTDNPETTEEKTEENTETAEETKQGEEITDLVIPKLATKEISGFNLLYTQKGEDFEGLSSLMDGLLEVDHDGKLMPAIAEEWGTEDEGHTWTFKIREGVKWVNVNGEEVGECNAQDFATGLEWVLNFHKNDSVNTSMPLEMIEGAQEYYEYTKTLSKEEAYTLTAGEGSKFREMVGLDTPDDYTLVYTCIEKKPYFDTLAPYVSLYPASQELIDQLGVDGFRAINTENMWYNGCYTMTSYIQGNEKIYTRNPLYWDKDAKLFNTVTVKMVESNEIAFQLYQAGEVDYVSLGEAQITTIAKDPENEYYDYMVPDVPAKYCYQFQLNYHKLFSDGTEDVNWNTAVANEAFRLSWWYGLDLKEYYKRTNAVDPMVCENNFYTMKGLVYTSDGTDYTELVRQEMGLPEPNGETMVRLDAEKAAAYKQQAMEELTALGVTFPVTVDYYIAASSQTALDSANVLKQIFSDSLGDDYVELNIKTYVSSLRKEVTQAHLHSFIINGWGADYGDPQNYLGQQRYGYDNAYYSTTYSYINDLTEETEANKDLLNAYKEFTKMVDAADAITDNMDERYKAYAKAEAYFLEHALTIPCYYGIGWCLTKIDNDSKMNAQYGIQNDKMKNWDTNTEGYTSEEKGVADQIAAFAESK